jgi:Ca2+-binding EF-hand superfamily protein
MRTTLLVLAISSSSASAAEINPRDIELSPIMQLTIQRGLTAAAEQLASVFENHSSDGSTIDLATLDQVVEMKLAKRRAQKVYNYLSVDLNWDGEVTRAELERVFSEPNEKPFVDGWLKDGDLNSDGVISLQEMLQDASLEYPGGGALSNGFMAEMVGWDLNGDGILHFEEVLAVLEAHT